MTRHRPALTLGAGVQDPSLPGREPIDRMSELRRWAKMLSHFDRVTVRGPLWIFCQRAESRRPWSEIPRCCTHLMTSRCSLVQEMVGLDLGSDGSTSRNDPDSVASEM